MNNDVKFSMIKQIYTREEIPTYLKMFDLTDRICELGVAQGENLKTMISHTFPNYVLALDAWSEEVCPHYKQKRHDASYAEVQKYCTYAEKWSGAKIDVIKGDHSLLVDNYEDESFDYIHIDSDHRYEQVKRDIEQWWPKVKMGGILSGHDYTSYSELYGVIQAVNEFVKDNKIKYFHVTIEQVKTWIILKAKPERRKLKGRLKGT